MDVHAFLKGRPCLEEIDGYLDSLRFQIDNPELFHELQYSHIDGDVLSPIEAYRQRLMSGKDVPAPTRLERSWIYKLRTKPQRKRIPHGESPKKELQHNAGRPPLDLNARGRK